MQLEWRIFSARNVLSIFRLVNCPPMTQRIEKIETGSSREDQLSIGRNFLRIVDIFQVKKSP